MRRFVFLTIVALALQAAAAAAAADEADDREALEEDHAHDAEHSSSGGGGGERNLLSRHVLNAFVAFSAFLLLRQALKVALYVLGSRLLVKGHEVRLLFVPNNAKQSRVK